jgi:PKHD-type hydroxylase
MSNVWEWKNCLPAEVCETLIEKFYVPEAEAIAGIGNGAVDVSIDLPHRKTNVCWIPKEEYISTFLFSRALIANQKAGWGFDIEDCEMTQIGKYEDGGHYEWHKDENFFVRRKNYHRKVSVVAFLSDPKTYTGGDFLMLMKGEQKIEASLGSIICFPSEIVHKVTPVTEGVRYSLVLWANGPQMR